MISPVAKIVALRPERYLKRDNPIRDEEDIMGIVVHTTGSGPLQRWKEAVARGEIVTPFEVCVNRYQKVLKYGPHYVVGQEAGQVAAIVPEYRTALHVGNSNSRHYTQRTRAYTRSLAHTAWRGTWAPLVSPTELLRGYAFKPRPDGKPSVNHWTIGIEVLPPLNDPQGKWSPECYRNLALLCQDLTQRYDIPFSDLGIVSHSDLDPLNRSTVKGLPWDPSMKAWSRSTPEYLRDLCLPVSPQE